MKELEDLKRKIAYCNRYNYCINEVEAIAEAFRALEQRAEAAEAKLAELEKQDPYGYADPKAIERMINGYTRFYTVKPERSVRNRLPVFINPAPAINLAELVPDEISPDDALKILAERYGEFGRDHHFCCDSFEVGANWRRSQILRKIEDAQNKNKS